MGFEKAFDYQNTAEVYAEHCRSTIGTNIDISGLSYEFYNKNALYNGHIHKKRLFKTLSM
jgi:ferredoxin-nitrate reductase